MVDAYCRNDKETKLRRHHSSPSPCFTPITVSPVRELSLSTAPEYAFSDDCKGEPRSYSPRAYSLEEASLLNIPLRRANGLSSSRDPPEYLPPTGPKGSGNVYAGGEGIDVGCSQRTLLLSDVHIRPQANEEHYRQYLCASMDTADDVASTSPVLLICH